MVQAEELSLAAMGRLVAVSQEIRFSQYGVTGSLRWPWVNL